MHLQCAETRQHTSMHAHADCLHTRAVNSLPFLFSSSVLHYIICLTYVCVRVCSTDQGRKKKWQRELVKQSKYVEIVFKSVFAIYFFFFLPRYQGN